MVDFKLAIGTVLSSVCKTYDWVINDGRKNLGKWADEAGEIRGKYGDQKITGPGGGQKTEKANTAAASAGFAPRSPWCSNDGNR